MQPELSHFYLSIFAGVFATGLMDLGAIVGTRLGFMSKPNVAFLGRWVIEIIRGRIICRSGTIATVAPFKGEKIVGIGVHYLIGCILAGIYFGGLLLLQEPSRLWNASLFGATTNAFPWLVMFPALGFGYFGSKVPKEAKLFRTSFINHLVYGIGLFLAAKIY